MPQCENAPPGIDYAEAELFLKPHGCEAAEDTSEVRRQKWHPGEQGDVLQIHVPNAAEVQRQPEAQSTPGRIGRGHWLRNTRSSLCRTHTIEVKPLSTI